MGPLVGPLVGGALSQALGWRSTFAAMAILGAVIDAALLLFMEETHHYHVLQVGLKRSFCNQLCVSHRRSWVSSSTPRCFFLWRRPTTKYHVLEVGVYRTHAFALQLICSRKGNVAVVSCTTHTLPVRILRTDSCHSPTPSTPAHLLP